MARFNVYDPLLSDECWEEEEESKDMEEEKVEIPPISEDAIETLSYKRGLHLLRDNDVKTDQMKTLEDIKCFLRLRYFTNKEDNVVSRTSEFRTMPDVLWWLSLITHDNGFDYITSFDF